MSYVLLCLTFLPDELDLFTRPYYLAILPDLFTLPFYLTLLTDFFT